MFVPLHDQNPLRYITFPWATRGIVVINCLIFVFYQNLGAAEAARASVLSYALIPSTLTGFHLRPPDAIVVPEYLTFVTSSFLHGDIWHLVGNMLFLWILGDNVEDAVGHLRFLLFYLACTIGGGLAHVLADPQSDAAMIGASGSVAGVIAAYLLLHPRVKIWILLFFRIPMKLMTVWVLGFWIALQVWNVATSADAAVAWWAHVGGLLAGALLILVMRRPGVPLLAREVPSEAVPEPR